MKKTTKIILAVAMFFSFQFSVFNSVVSAQDAEYQLIRRSYKVNGDGTVDIGFRKEIKLLRNRAITAYADKGETFILYNPAIDELTINESYTIRPDGSRVQTPANAFVDQLPEGCQDCGRYNGIRERAVIHTALEYNCVIVLDYTIHRKTQRLEERIVMTEDCPIKRYEVLFDVEDVQGDDVAFVTNNMPKGAKFKKNEPRSWHLELRDLPQSFKDSYLPSPYTMYPWVRIHYDGRRDGLSDASDSRRDGLSDGSDVEPIPEANNVIAELFENDKAKYVANIRDYVVDYIKVNDIDAALLDYRVSTARETFLSACGTMADKNNLLASMLKEAGFEVRKEKDAVVVKLKEKDTEKEYRLSAAAKGEMRPVGTAIEEQRSIEVEKSIPWHGKRLGGGYLQMEIPTEKGGMSINPARLTSDRKAPLQVGKCNEKYHYTIALPRTPSRRLVGEPVEISYSKKGIGSIRISISQERPGAGIEVIRELNIDVPDGIVTPKQYKDFRQMMQDWNGYRTITIK